MAIKPKEMVCFYETNNFAIIGCQSCSSSGVQKSGSRFVLIEAIEAIAVISSEIAGSG